MKLDLKPYQKKAVAELLERLRDARDDYHRPRSRRSAFSLTAPTGAGKTVIAAAVLEALFNGSDEHNFPADPGAVVLWFTDDPSLNEQTRHRIIQASDRISHGRLRVIGSKFVEEKLAPGNVYFLNQQKLSKNSLLVRGGWPEDGQMLIAPDLRARTFWEILDSTISDERLTLYLILDEAHRGMRPPSASDRKTKSTIVRQLINGEAGAPPIPVVLGISATVERFDTAMADSQHDRMRPPNVIVDAGEVKESGLLKDDVRLVFPDEKGVFETLLLREAVAKIKASSRAWADYQAAQGGTDELVAPLLVVQVPNTPQTETLAEWLTLIRQEWPELEADGIAHVFGEHTELVAGAHTVPYVPPQDVQERSHIRVLLAKEAITTGWDCPRAEVLVSFRPADDKVHITQMLGRMVRTPLARRIPGDDRLNAVECILPKFNRDAARSVAAMILGSDRDGELAETAAVGQRVLIGAAEMTANAAIPETVWQAFDEVPSETVPRRGARPVARLRELAHALSFDGFVTDAHKQADKELIGVLDGLRARFREEHADAVDDVKTATLAEIVASVHGGEVIGQSVFAQAADERAVEEAYRAAGRVFGKDLARKYADHVDAEQDEDDGLLSAHIEVAALARIEGVAEELDRAAGALADKWLAEHRAAIKTRSDERQQVYRGIREQAGAPGLVELVRPVVRIEATRTLDGEMVPTRPQHLLSDANGEYPIGDLKSEWERHVVEKELARPGTIAWYRNPSRPSVDAVAIAYEDGQGGWRRLYPDLVFFAEAGGKTRPYIVDPHGHFFADSIPKLQGLSRFADEYGDRLLRIDAVAKIDGTYRVLDVLEPGVRDAIEAATSAEALFRSNVASDY